MTLPRIITAVFFAPLVLGVIWLGQIPFFLFVLGIALLAVWEYSLMADQGGYPNQLVMSMVGTFMLLAAFFLDGVPGWAPLHKSPSVLFVFVVWLLLRLS